MEGDINKSLTKYSDEDRAGFMLVTKAIIPLDYNFEEFKPLDLSEEYKDSVEKNSISYYFAGTIFPRATGHESALIKIDLSNVEDKNTFDKFINPLKSFVDGGFLRYIRDVSQRPKHCFAIVVCTEEQYKNSTNVFMSGVKAQIK